MVRTVGSKVRSILEAECIDNAQVWTMARNLSFSWLPRVCYVFGGVSEMEEEESRCPYIEGREAVLSEFLSVLTYDELVTMMAYSDHEAVQSKNVFVELDSYVHSTNVKACL